MNQINLNTYLKNNIQERLYLILDHFQPQGKVLLDVGKSLAVESDNFRSKYNLEYIGLELESLEKISKAYIDDLIHGKKIAHILLNSDMDNIVKYDNILAILKKICVEHKCCVTVGIFNGSFQNRVLDFFVGENEFNVNENGVFYVEKQINSMTGQLGFVELDNRDIKIDLVNYSRNTLLTSNTLTNQYLTNLKKIVDTNYNTLKFFRTYMPSNQVVLPEKKVVNKYFLSVVMRTQGKRIFALKEVLLNLAGQTYENFEILLLAHKVNDDEIAKINEVVDFMPEYIKNRIRLIRVDTGNRSKPLNVGFEEALGEYISVLDDDDIVFDNWVETFYKCFKRNSGKILRTYCVKQKWQVYKTIDGTYGMTATNSPDTYYPNRVDFIKQLNRNTCPTFTLAYPAYCFQNFKIIFDENLDTTEDWDFFMRTAFLTGIAEEESITGIYRFLDNSENSRTIHSENEWKINHSYVQRKFNQSPLLIPKEDVSCLFQGDEDIEDYNSEDNNKSSIKSSVLYLDYGNGFSQENIIKRTNKGQRNEFDYFYEIKAENNKIKELRWDPVEGDTIFLKKLIIKLIYTDETFEYIPENGFINNGMKISQGIYFPTSDPQIIFYPGNNKRIKSISIKGQFTEYLPEEYLHYLQKQTKIKVLIKKILSIFK